MKQFCTSLANPSASLLSPTVTPFLAPSLAEPKPPIVFGSLFAGIGGLDLGLERAGMKSAFQVEVDPYCQRILAKHWPDVPRFGDIRTVTPEELPPVDALVGGFPCQPHSLAGKRLASKDERDLWSDYLRLIQGLKPRWVIAENVPGLLTSEKGEYFGRFLNDLHTSGYDAEWRCITASAQGAPHRRERIFIVAYPHGNGRFFQRGLFTECSPEAMGPTQIARSPWANHNDLPVEISGSRYHPLARGVRVAYGVPGGMDTAGNASDGSLIPEYLDGVKYEGTSPAERTLIKKRIKGCGNAVVPRVAEYVGHTVMNADSLIRASSSSAFPTH